VTAPDALDASDTAADEPAVSERMLRASAVVGIGTALSRITGFLRVAAIAYALGAAALAGTYSYANETPNMLYELLLGGVLTATLVPQFVRHVEREDKEAISAIFTIAMVALVVVSVLGVLLAPVIVELFTLRVEGGDKVAQQDVATTLVRLFMPQMLFYGFIALATAVLHAHRRFAAAAFAPILNNIVVIAIFVSLPRLVDGPITLERVRNDTPLLLTLGLGTTAGIAAVALVLVPALVLTGVHLRPRFDWRHHAVITMARLSGWTVGYVIANQIALWIVLVLANGSDGGPFVYLSAYAFFQLPHGLLAVSLMTTTAPEMASAAERGDLDGVRTRLSAGLRLTTVVILPCAAALVALARPSVVALLQRGAFDASDAALVAETVAGFAVGLVFFSSYLFALRAFYSLQDTRTPFFLNCAENALNLVLAVPLYAWLGIPGLALAFSGAYAGASVLTLVALHRRIGGVDGRRLAHTTARALLPALAATLAGWGVAEALGWSGSAEAILTTVVGLVAVGSVYLAGVVALRLPELTELLRLVPTGRGRRRAPT
jgi:putative peptidoglycan lipid II flippase